VRVDVRLISATNRNLLSEVRAGRFREDLFYRLHVFPIAVPPLRERPEDIPQLVRHFLARFSAEEGKKVRVISGEAWALLGSYQWPGNVRQLENTIFRAVVLAEGDTIGTSELPQIAAQISCTADSSTASLAISSELASVPAPMIADDSPAWVSQPTACGAALGTHATIALLDADGQMRPLETIEAEAISFAITHYRGQMSEVARRLRIGRSTLYRKLEGLGLEPDAENSVAAG
jgi:DNA-binding NtrC family response regulator